MAPFFAFLIYYRLMQEWCSSRESGSSISEWQPLATIDAHHNANASSRADRVRGVEFRISPWPWVKAVGLVLALIISPILLIGAITFQRFQHLPLLTERFAVPLLALAIVALSVVLFGGLFILNYRIIHFKVGTHCCNFRLGPTDGADVRNIVFTRHGAFSLDRIGALWSRERLSSVLKWKVIHYGITFKTGDQLHLGSTGRYSASRLATLDWEQLLIELSRRSGIAISRSQLGQVSIGSP
jgi:hypothetical protein